MFLIQTPRNGRRRWKTLSHSFESHTSEEYSCDVTVGIRYRKRASWEICIVVHKHNEPAVSAIAFTTNSKPQSKVNMSPTHLLQSTSNDRLIYIERKHEFGVTYLLLRSKVSKTKARLSAWSKSLRVHISVQTWKLFST